MTREFWITLAVAVGFWLLGKVIVYLLQKTKGDCVALICLLVFAGFWAAIGTMLTMAGIGGLVMAPLFPGKIFAFFMLLPGLWLLAVFILLVLGAIFNQEGSPINQFLLKLVPILFNPTSLLPSVQPNPNLFKFSVTDPERLEITPFWQLPVLGIIYLSMIIGFGILIAWKDYLKNSPQGAGLFLVLLLLPVMFMGIRLLWAILQGNFSLIIQQDGIFIPTPRNMRRTFYHWDEVQEFKVVCRGCSELVVFQNKDGKEKIIPNIFPISNKDLLEILKNRQAHYLKSDSLTDVTSYKGTRWIEHPMVIWSLVTLPLLALYMCFIHQS